MFEDLKNIYNLATTPGKFLAAKVQENVSNIAPQDKIQDLAKGVAQTGANLMTFNADPIRALAPIVKDPIGAVKNAYNYVNNTYIRPDVLTQIANNPGRTYEDLFNALAVTEGGMQGVKALKTLKTPPTKVNPSPTKTYKPMTINKSMGGDAINVKPNTRNVIKNNLKNYEVIDLTKGDNFPEELNVSPTEFQEVYHSSPVKGIREFNPVEHFGETDPGFYGKNMTYFSPEPQNSIPYGARVKGDAYLKNPSTHSPWVKDQLGYLASEATDIYTGKINPERFRNSILNEIEYRTNVGDINKANELKAALNDYNGNTVAEMGSIYKAQIPSDKYLLNWDKPISEQSPMVKEIARELNISPNQSGEILYNNLLKQYQGNAIEANQFLDDVGIYGFTGGDTIGIEKGIFNPKHMKILEENSVLSPQYREYIK